MDKDQEVLTEILKLKMYLVKKLSSHTFAVPVQDVLDKVNESLNNLEKNKI